MKKSLPITIAYCIVSWDSFWFRHTTFQVPFFTLISAEIHLNKIMILNALTTVERENGRCDMSILFFFLKQKSKCGMFPHSINTHRRAAFPFSYTDLHHIIVLLSTFRVCYATEMLDWVFVLLCLGFHFQLLLTVQKRNKKHKSIKKRIRTQYKCKILSLPSDAAQCMEVVMMVFVIFMVCITLCCSNQQAQLIRFFPFGK